jgi:hypothetical protein
VILPRSLTVEWHKYRGFSLGSDLFDHCAVLGFVTLIISKQRMSDRLRELLDALKTLKGDER